MSPYRPITPLRCTLRASSCTPASRRSSAQSPRLRILDGDRVARWDCPGAVPNPLFELERRHHRCRYTSKYGRKRRKPNGYFLINKNRPHIPSAASCTRIETPFRMRRPSTSARNDAVPATTGRRWSVQLSAAGAARRPEYGHGHKCARNIITTNVHK